MNNKQVLKKMNQLCSKIENLRQKQQKLVDELEDLQDKAAGLYASMHKIICEQAYEL